MYATTSSQTRADERALTRAVELATVSRVNEVVRQCMWSVHSAAAAASRAAVKEAEAVAPSDDNC